MKQAAYQKRWSFFLMLIGICCLLAAGGARAEVQPQLELKTTLQKEVKVKKDGHWSTERVPADKTSPGDVLLYTITYRNAGKTAATEARIVNPVPKGLVYIAESAEGADTEISCSIDNSRSWHSQPVMIPVKGSDGTLLNKPAPLEQYSHIRWVIKKPVQPGQSGQVRFKVHVK